MMSAQSYFYTQKLDQCAILKEMEVCFKNVKFVTCFSKGLKKKTQVYHPLAD